MLASARLHSKARLEQARLVQCLELAVDGTSHLDVGGLEML